MPKSIDLKVVEFKEQLINLVNGSQLPLTCVMFAVSELLQVVSHSLDVNLAEEKKKLAEEKGDDKNAV